MVADLGVRGVWAAQTEALFDIRVMDTDARSYTSRTVDSVLLSAENEKNIEARHASFTPFVTSIDGVLGREANSVMKLLATKIALKWEKPLSEVTGWVRARLAFAILRATNLCIRGSRVKWRSAVHMDDGLHQLMNRICVCVCMCSSMLFIHLYLSFIIIIEPSSVEYRAELVFVI